MAVPVGMKYLLVCSSFLIISILALKLDPTVLQYKIIALVSIVVAGIEGVFLPIVSGLGDHRLAEIEAFGIVVMFAAEFFFVVPQAYETLTSPKLKEHPWAKYPIFFSFVASIIALLIERVVYSHYRRLVVHVPVSRRPHRFIIWVLEFGMRLHRIIFGIGLGVTTTTNAITPLMISLYFYQLFQCLVTGKCIAEVTTLRKTTIVKAFYSCLMSPLGIAIGIGIANSYDEGSPKLLLIQGILNVVSAVILTYSYILP